MTDTTMITASKTTDTVMSGSVRCGSVGVGRDEFVEGVEAGVPDVVERSKPIVCHLQAPTVEAVTAVTAVGSDRHEFRVGEDFEVFGHLGLSQT